jgi:hypothetical protein
MYLPMLGGYLENPNMLTKYHPRYHLLNPLEIKSYNICGDIIIFQILKFGHIIFGLGENI